MFNNLTIVIPSYKRHSFLKRSIAYWESLGVNLIIMDGSPEKLEYNFGKDTLYFHDPTSFLERLKKTITLVKSPFVSLLSDDEFYLSSGIKECIKVLDENEEIKSCYGQCLYFKNEKNVIKYRLQYPKLKGYDFLEDNGIDRMKRHMLDYTPSYLYSIMRTEQWQKCMDLMTKRIIDVYSLLEIQFEMAAAFHGKSKAIPNLLWLRSGENIPIRNEPGLFTDKLFHLWWNDKSKSNEHEIVINDCLSNFNNSYHSELEIRKGIIDTFDNVAKFQLSLEQGIVFKLNKIFPKLMFYLSNWKKKILPKVHFNSFDQLDIKSLNNMIIDKNELSKINDLLMKYHNE